ncbi:MAG: alkaline phosphatase family protein [Microbacter sp.]
MKKLIVSFLILLLFVPLSLFGSTHLDKPRLVVFIVVDGLKTEHIHTLWNDLNKGGFKRLYQQGAVCNHAYYPIMSTGLAPDVATLATGSTPFYHGIVGDSFYHRVTDALQPCLEDDRYNGIGTADALSLQALLASTCSDELKMNTGGKSKIFSIGIHAPETMLLAGHAADGAVWVNRETANLATSTFFPLGLPRWADQANVNHWVENGIKQEWKPLYNITSYFFPANHPDATYGFDYLNNGSSMTQIMAAFKTSPFVNTLVKNLALKAIHDESMGQDDYPDFLGLEFSVEVGGDPSSELSSAEKEDIYLRLDNDLADLINQIDAYVGLNHTVIVLTGTQGEPHQQKTLEKYNIPTGQFVPVRSMALLNLYLMALYGQHQWVLGCHDKNIYLDHAYIEQKGISLQQIQEKTAQFMLELQGVQTALTASEIMAVDGNGFDEASRMKNSFNKRRSGDVVFTLMPGWVEMDNHGKVLSIDNDRHSYVPVVFFGDGIEPQLLSNMAVTDIAPTLSSLLQTQFPNANVGVPIPLLTKPDESFVPQRRDK